MAPKSSLRNDDGYRESTDSWASALRSLRDRGMQAPIVAVGDGALGFWAAARDVWPRPSSSVLVRGELAQGGQATSTRKSPTVKS